MFGQRALKGPRLPPLRGAPTHLVVLCHGYGADGNDLIGLAPHWQRFLPTVAFAAPNAPERCQAAGFQWFALSRMDLDEIRRGVELAAPCLDAFVDSELARLGLAPDRLILAGFSQGAMMSLHVGVRRAVKPIAIIGYSGMLATSEGLNGLGLHAPPVLLVHGDQDATIPPEALFAAAGALGQAGFLVQWHLARGIPHAIDPEGLLLGASFASMAVRGGLRRGAEEICCRLG